MTSNLCKHGPTQWLDESAQRAHVKDEPKPSYLDELIRKEAEASEQLAQAFIRVTMARNKLFNHLEEVRQNQPNLFTDVGMSDC